MHPKKFARVWAVAGLLAVGLMGLTGGIAGAQEKKDPPMAVPGPSGAVTVNIGGQVRIQMKTKKRIAEAFNENDRVVRVLVNELDNTTLILIGQAVGTSKLELRDVDGVRESYLVVVERDLELLRKLIRDNVPTANVKVAGIGESGSGVILSGYTSREDDKDTLEKLAKAVGLNVAVNTVTVGGGGNVPHVQLDVTIAKVDRTRARNRGANFVINGNTVSTGSLLGGLTSLTPGTIGTSAVNAVGAGLNPQTGVAVPGSSANILAGYAPWNIQALFAALKTEGLAKLVAAPTVVARSGEEASLLVGGQVPVISAAAGITGPGVTYRDVGTQLTFLPIVYGNGKIHLTVSPSVRSVNNTQALTTTFGTSPAFEEQRMTTSVICEPGQTIAIGGLIQTSQQATVVKIPHLGDIPYLGYLFSVATQTEQEIELVILLTPRLIDPADCNQMPKGLPGSETRKPDDYEFYLETILEAPRGQRPIWNGLEYVPAWKSSNSANLYPCPGGSAAGCSDGKCAPATAPAASPAGGSGRVTIGPSAALPPIDGPVAATDPLLTAPPGFKERKTAELPKK
jgi:pilus assembly protein CpaC